MPQVTCRHVRVGKWPVLRHSGQEKGDRRGSPAPGTGDYALTIEHRIAALWIGGDLSFLEQLCLKSFVDAGHHVTLYRYEPIGNAPGGVEQADAARILPRDGILRHARTGSPALHSDLFRYHLLAAEDRVIWADTDAYCLRPFRTATGHFHGWETKTGINGGVLALPQDSQTLAALLDFTSDPHAIPPWVRGPTRRALEAARDAGTPVHAADMAWGAWGPHALTHFLMQTGEARHSLPIAALYPVPFRDRNALLRPGADMAGYITDETVSIHFYGRRIRSRLLAGFDGVPRPRSLLGQLLRKHGIDPLLAPIPVRADAPVGEDAVA